jgi:hypothetical protein
MLILSLQHMQYLRYTFATSHKTLKHKSEKHVTLETQRRRRPRPTWWGTPVTSKLGLGGRQEQRPSVNPGAGVGL